MCGVGYLLEDTGCGIRQEGLGKIFEDFRQVNFKKNRSVDTEINFAEASPLGQKFSPPSHKLREV